MNSVRGKTVLIVGASSGIGAAVAREFSRLGAHLVLAARRKDRLEELRKELEAGGGQAISVDCDVTRDGEVERAIEEGKARFGQIDIVLANAGFGVVGKVERLSLEDFRRQFETNIFGVIRTSKASLPELKRVKGTLGIVGSVAGHIAIAEASPYAMSKFAVRAFADALRSEVRSSGVAVTLISPGFVESEIRLVDNKGSLQERGRDPIPGWLRMKTPAAARAIVRALRSRRREAIITFHGKVFVFLKRHFSAPLAWVFDSISNRKDPGKGA